MATGALDILWAMLCCSRICHGVSACLLLLKTGMLLDYYDSKRCFESPYAPGNGAQRLGSIRRNRNWLLTLLLGSHFFSQLRLSPKQFVSMICFREWTAFTDALIVLCRKAANNFRFFHLNAKVSLHKIDSCQDGQE